MSILFISFKFTSSEKNITLNECQLNTPLNRFQNLHNNTITLLHCDLTKVLITNKIVVL